MKMVKMQCEPGLFNCSTADGHVAKMYYTGLNYIILWFPWGT